MLENQLEDEMETGLRAQGLGSRISRLDEILNTTLDVFTYARDAPIASGKRGRSADVPTLNRFSTERLPK